MFDQIFQNLQRATECNIKLQQELVQKWTNLWTGFLTPPRDAGERAGKVQKEWVQFQVDLAKKQRQTLEPQVKAGLQIIEETCRLGQAKNVEEVRARTIELVQKSLQCQRRLVDALMDDFQASIRKWTELVIDGTAPQEETAEAA
jgi:hypothetical protein